MKIEITGGSVSKKGTVWLQAKLLEGETPSIGTVLECEKIETKKEKIEDEKAKD